jgi:hypothetical protein
MLPIKLRGCLHPPFGLCSAISNPSIIKADKFGVLSLAASVTLLVRSTYFGKAFNRKDKRSEHVRKIHKDYHGDLGLFDKSLVGWNDVSCVWPDHQAVDISLSNLSTNIEEEAIGETFGTGTSVHGLTYGPSHTLNGTNIMQANVGYEGNLNPSGDFNGAVSGPGHSGYNALPGAHLTGLSFEQDNISYGMILNSINNFNKAICD